MSDLTPQSETPTPTTDKITQAARETIYLCNFRVSVDGDWLCLRELNDISLTPDPEPAHEGKVIHLVLEELCFVTLECNCLGVETHNAFQGAVVMPCLGYAMMDFREDTSV